MGLSCSDHPFLNICLYLLNSAELGLMGILLSFSICPYFCPSQYTISYPGHCQEKLESIEGYVLPLLPKAPVFLHNMHFKTKVTSECYPDLDLPIYKENNGKYHTEVIGDTHVSYIFYSSGTVNINAICSKKAYKLETEDDRSRIIAFFGQVRDRLILLVRDKHERLVLDIMEWSLTEADINRDIK